MILTTDRGGDAAPDSRTWARVYASATASAGDFGASVPSGNVFSLKLIKELVCLDSIWASSMLMLYWVRCTAPLRPLPSS